MPRACPTSVDPGEHCQQNCCIQHENNATAGDLVDRGSWGVELFLAVAVLKLADPSRYIILRGNHESNWCTKMYGFKKELESKYPHKRRPQAGARKLNIGSFISTLLKLPCSTCMLASVLQSAHRCMAAPLHHNSSCTSFWTGISCPFDSACYT